MKCTNAQPDGTALRRNRRGGARCRLVFGVAMVVCAAMLSGCAAPPSVGPLLALADRAMREEASRQEEDLARDLEHVSHVRRSLAAAFEKDLVQTDALTADWVRDAVDVYAAAREELARHEMRLRAARQQRADNLVAGREALQRAAGMLQMQDDFVTRTLGATAWQIIAPETNRPE